MSLTRKEERDLWQQWKDTKSQFAFDKLLESFEPLISNEVNRYAGNVSRVVLRGEAIKLFIKALKTFDPGRGAQLGTWVTSQLKKLYRFNLAHQNVARIQSEYRAGKIGMYNTVTSFLTDSLGRMPTTNEIAEEMNIPHSEVARIRTDLRRDLTLNKDFDTRDMGLGLGTSYSPMKDKLMSIYHMEARPDEKLVMEYLFGLGGKQQVTAPAEIAKLMGVPSPKINQIKKKIYRKLERR